MGTIDRLPCARCRGTGESSWRPAAPVREEDADTEPEADDQNPYPPGSQAAGFWIARRPWLRRREAD